MPNKPNRPTGEIPHRSITPSFQHSHPTPFVRNEANSADRLDGRRTPVVQTNPIWRVQQRGGTPLRRNEANLGKFHVGSFKCQADRAERRVFRLRNVRNEANWGDPAADGREPAVQTKPIRSNPAGTRGPIVRNKPNSQRTRHPHRSTIPAFQSDADHAKRSQFCRWYGGRPNGRARKPAKNLMRWLVGSVSIQWIVLHDDSELLCLTHIGSCIHIPRTSGFAASGRRGKRRLRRPRWR